EALFIAEGDDGVDLGGAASWEEAGGQADGDNDGHDGGKRDWVRGRDAGDLGGEKARQGKACEQAETDPDCYQTEAVEKHQAKNGSLLGAQRHTDAEFAGLQRDRVAHHAKHADDYQDEADRGEHGDRCQFELWAAIELAEGRFQRSGNADGYARING